MTPHRGACCVVDLKLPIAFLKIVWCKMSTELLQLVRFDCVIEFISNFVTNIFGISREAVVDVTAVENLQLARWSHPLLDHLLWYGIYLLLKKKSSNGATDLTPLKFKKYKTFSVLIYSYINTSGNWKNEKLCGNTTPAGRSVFTQFRVFPIFTSVDITVYQYG